MKRISRIGARGFSLVELLVAMAVTMVVIGGVLTLFDKSNRMTKTETGVSDAQQSARYGSYLLVRDVRMAGAGGVSSSTALG
jgi:type IV pilus assembly protein PilW